MKTLRRLNSALFAFGAAFIMALTGCQKDEMQELNSSAPTTAEENYAKDVNQPTPFQMVLIDHHSAQDQNASYSVNVLSDGRMIFHGRFNTAIIGIREVKLSNEMMQSIQVYFAQDSWKNMEQEVITAELPLLTVSYTPDKLTRPITITENEVKPGDLQQFIKGLETLLNIRSFVIYPDRENVPFPVDQF